MAAAVPERDIARLRADIARIEGRGAARLEAPAANVDAGRCADLVVTGATALDRALGGGLAATGLGEIRTGATADAGAACGFVAALAIRMAEARGVCGPVLWIGGPQAFGEAGTPHAAGLLPFGLEPQRLLMVAARRIADALWIAGEAARTSALGLTVLELRGNPRDLDLTASRRLAMAARETGRPLLLLRQAGLAEASAALFRLAIASAPARPRRVLQGSALETVLPGSIGPPAFAVTIEKQRGAATGLAPLVVEWNVHERLFADRPSAAAGPGDAHGHARRGAGALPRPRPAAACDGPDRTDALGRAVAFGRAS